MNLRECWDRHQCLKSVHQYDRIYQPIFEPIRYEPLRILEIGIFKGASIAAWLDYFPHAFIVGIDTFQRLPPEEVGVLNHGRVDWHQMDSTSGLDMTLPTWQSPFDIIIDDGDHRPLSQLKTFKNYYPLLKGMYFIEDVWPDKPGFAELNAGLPESAVHHDLRRRTGKPDSYIIQI